MASPILLDLGAAGMYNRIQHTL